MFPCSFSTSTRGICGLGDLKSTGDFIERVPRDDLVSGEGTLPEK